MILDPKTAGKLGFETLAIHAGQDADPLTGAVVTPIYQTSTYKQDGIGGTRGGYEYSRTANPTRTALETCLAALENGARAFAFASGMAAEDCLIRTLCRPGDRVIIPGDAYGGTFRLFDKVMRTWGVEHTPVRQTDLDAVAKAAAEQRPRLIWAESPTNPLLSIVDIQALAVIAHDHGAMLVVDNTFASPYLQRPLDVIKVRCVDVGERQLVAPEHLVEQAERTAVRVVGDHDMIAGRQHRSDRANRRHS